MKNQIAKILFGAVIFLFSVALAYFTASYMGSNMLFSYWGTVAIFACAYVLVGIAIVFIFPISLGFLFAADVLVMDLLFNYYGGWADILKLTVIGVMLVILYPVAFFLLRDADKPISQPPQGEPGV